jgi:ribosomal protein L7/L12
MAVNRNQMARALAKPQGVSVQRVAPVATTSQYSDPNAQLAYGQGLVNKAVSGQGFDPQGGWGVAAAQIATAGIGAWAQNRARKEIAEKEVASQQQFAESYPEYANMASQLSPETRQAYSVAKMSQDLKAQDPLTVLDLQTKELGLVKTKAEITKLNKETTGDGLPDAKDVFDNTTKVRKEFVGASGEFIKQKDAYDRIQASIQEPSAAGDLALIFNYMKLLDPGSTVREGEFATAQNSAGVPERLRAQFNKVSSGERLGAGQRDDFSNRSEKLYDKALNSQDNRIKQYTGIAERNKLPVQDVIVDLVGQRPADVRKTAQDKALQTLIPQGYSGFKIISIK